MKMHYPPHGDYEMNNHVVEYEVNRRIGWRPEAGRGHPDTAPGSTAQTRWGHRWTYQLTPDGPDATIVTETYDCSQAPEDKQASMDGRIWVKSMTDAGTAGRALRQRARLGRHLEASPHGSPSPTCPGIWATSKSSCPAVHQPSSLEFLSVP